MPVVGVVLVLDDADPRTRAAVSASLGGAGDLLLGDPAGHKWPVVLESPDRQGVEARIDQLRLVRGIAGVDVVYADFEDLLGSPFQGDLREEP